jgi:hypothetical protein
MANKFPGNCYRCGTHHNAGAANLVRVNGAWAVQCITPCEINTAPVAAAQRGPVQVGDLGGVLALFDRAAAHLKRPAIVLAVPGVGNGELRLSVAGERSSQPGTITVSETGQFESRLWYGRIQRSGAYQPSRDGGRHADAIVARLRALAQDPVGVASEFGRLTGRCCFCNRGLDDERSTAVGYGPVCADHYGLPWGAKPAQFAAAAA